MADVPAAAPQEFTFGTKQLSGNLISYSGRSQRRGVVHQFLKRRGGIVEDMNSEPRRLEVELVFSGKSPARDFNEFESYVSDNPTQLLVHPQAGRYIAFCEGPQYHVGFAQATNEIRVRVSFIESELDSTTRADVPDVPTAQQSVSAEQTAYQKVVAAYVGALARANTAVASARQSIKDLIDQIDTFTDPVTSLVTGCLSLPGLATSVVGNIQSIQVLNDILNQQVSDYLDQASDLFTGEAVLAGSADSVTNLLGVVENTCHALENLMLGTGTPAGCADAVGSVEELLASCIILGDAVLAARRRTVVVVLPRLTDLMSFCQKRYPSNAVARASEIQSLNHILNPAAIPAGTRLVVPID